MRRVAESHLISFQRLLSSQLLYFTHNVREWLDRDPKNVIAVHCKGGKGD